MIFTTDMQTAFTGTVSIDNARFTVNDAACREVWTTDVFHQAFNADIRIIGIGQAGINHFGKVMRCHVGRHTDSNTGRTIHQQVWNTGWQNVRNTLRAIVVIDPIYGIFFQIGQEFMGQLGHTYFGITHCGRTIAINRTKVPLSIYQLVT